MLGDLTDEWTDLYSDSQKLLVSILCVHTYTQNMAPRDKEYKLTLIDKSNYKDISVTNFLISELQCC